jgi:hypothetical protein
MKKIFGRIGLALCISGTALAQGTIEFNNCIPGVVHAPVFSDLGFVLTGNIAGAQLWAGADSLSMQPVGPRTIFWTGDAAGCVISPGEVVVPGVPPGAFAFAQLRAWDAAFASSFEELPAGSIFTGGSIVIQVGPLGDGAALPAARLIGLEAFTFTVIPEPSTIFLFLFGSVGLLVARNWRTRIAGTRRQWGRISTVDKWVNTGLAYGAYGKSIAIRCGRGLASCHEPRTPGRDLVP